MKYFFFILCMFCFSLISICQTEKYQILTYGFPSFGYNSIRDSLSSTYNVEFIAVAGCVVSEKLRDSVENHNSTVFSLLDLKYGFDWKTHFYSQLDEIRLENQNREERDLNYIDSLFILTFEEVKFNDAKIELKILKCENNQFLIRGFQNKLKIIDLTNQNRTFKIQGNGVNSEIDSSEINLFTLMPGLNEETKILIYENDQAVFGHSFKTTRIEEAQLQIGEISNGGIIDFQNLIFSIKFKNEAGLEISNAIKSWELEIGGNVFMGVTSELTQEALTEIKKHKSGETFSIIMKYKSYDRIVRSIYGRFKIP